MLRSVVDFGTKFQPLAFLALQQDVSQDILSSEMAETPLHVGEILR